MNTLKKKMNKKGFTLAELLIVVAIIAVLVAISIPIFTSQLEKSREAVDAANIRAAYAEVASSAITDDKTIWNSKEIKLKQTKKGWQSSIDFTGEIKDSESSLVASSVPTSCYVVFTPGTNGAPGTFAVTTAASTESGAKTAGVDD